MSQSADSRSGSTAGQHRRNPAESSPVSVGDVVAEKYRVEEILAAGGMGVVVAARHVQLGQRFAIKFLLPHQAEHAERFLREARAAARIESTHVCRVFDCGSLPNGAPYMVMEHLSGHDLARELKTRGRLGVTEAVDATLQAIEGIAAAHGLGIIHRDLKPSNLFLCRRPGGLREVKVLDFGISKVAKGFEESVEDDLTSTSSMLGSPRYMSPEQVQSAKSVDARTDVWSLGVILYQMLDGQSPFKGTTMGETLGKVLTHSAPPIAQVRPDVPGTLAHVVDRCLERDRERRYRNVAELALALAPFASAEGKTSVARVTALLVEGQLDVPYDSPERTRVEVPALQSSSLATGSAATDEPSLGTQSAFTHGAAARPRSARLVLALGGVVLVAAGGAWLALRFWRAPAASAAQGQSAPVALSSSGALSARAAPKPAQSAVVAKQAVPAAHPSSTPTPEPEPSAVDVQAAPQRPSKRRVEAVKHERHAIRAAATKAKARPRAPSDNNDLLKESY